jgi:hypothetical protein
VKAKTLWRVASTASSLALLLGSMAPIALAGVDGGAYNDTTGADSENKAEIEITQETTVVQDNHADIDNEVSLHLNTGDNEADKNTGAGDVKTGDALMGVAISNEANTNVAEVSGCGGCDMDLQASNTKTGADSWNKAEVEVEKSTEIFQDNWSDIENEVKADLNTGENQANKNTGEGSIKTGDAEATVFAETDANHNIAVLGLGEGSGLVLGAHNDTTGADSGNKAEVEAELATLVSQSNWADIDNDVWIKANTGDNEADKNTGAGDIRTGAIDAAVGLDTTANTNFAAYDGCCDVELDTGNTKTGADSWNKAEAEITSLFDVFQSNCGYEGQDEKPFGFWPWWRHDCGVENEVKGYLDTGHNQTNKNNSDLNQSGDIGAVVQVDTETNENTLGSTLDLPEFDWGEIDMSDFDQGSQMAWWMLFMGIFG